MDTLTKHWYNPSRELKPLRRDTFQTSSHDFGSQEFATPYSRWEGALGPQSPRATLPPLQTAFGLLEDVVFKRVMLVVVSYCERDAILSLSRVNFRFATFINTHPIIWRDQVLNHFLVTITCRFYGVEASKPDSHVFLRLSKMCLKELHTQAAAEHKSWKKLYVSLCTGAEGHVMEWFNNVCTLHRSHVPKLLRGQLVYNSTSVTFATLIRKRKRASFLQYERKYTLYREHNRVLLRASDPADSKRRANKQKVSHKKSSDWLNKWLNKEVELAIESTETVYPAIRGYFNANEFITAYNSYCRWLYKMHPYVDNNRSVHKSFAGFCILSGCCYATYE
jgi:hypothetical protein